MTKDKAVQAVEKGLSMDRFGILFGLWSLSLSRAICVTNCAGGFSLGLRQLLKADGMGGFTAGGVLSIWNANTRAFSKIDVVPEPARAMVFVEEPIRATTTWAPG